MVRGPTEETDTEKVTETFAVMCWDTVTLAHESHISSQLCLA